jgi:CHAT domain-containing protein
MEDLNEYYSFIKEIVFHDQQDTAGDLLDKKQNLLDEQLLRTLDEIIDNCDQRYRPYYSGLKDRIMPLVHNKIFWRWFAIEDNKLSFYEAKRLIVYLAHSDNNGNFERIKTHFADHPDFFNTIFKMITSHVVNKLFDVEDERYMRVWCRWAAYFLANPLALHEKDHSPLLPYQSYEAQAYLAWAELYAQNPFTVDEAAFCFHKAMEVINENTDKDGVRLILYNLGAIRISAIAHMKGENTCLDLDEPISSLQHSLKLCDETTPLYSLGLTLHALGNAYYYKKDNQSKNRWRSIRYFKRILTDRLFIDYPLRLGKLYMSMAGLYGDNNDERSQKKALDYYLKASELLEIEGTDYDRANLWYNFANYYHNGLDHHKNDNAEIGLNLVQASADLFLNQEDHINWAHARLLSGRFLFKGSRFREAIAASEDTIKFLSESEYPKLHYDAIMLCSLAHHRLTEQVGDLDFNAAKRLAEKLLLLVEKLPSHCKALALNDLASHYQENFGTSPIESQEMAHQIFLKAVLASVQTNPDPHTDAIISINLANSFIFKKTGNPIANIESAITILCFLLTSHPELTKEHEAKIHLLLAKAFMSKANPSKEDINSAEMFLIGAKLNLYQHADLRLWGRSIQELSKLALHKYKYDDSSLVNNAISKCSNLLEALSETADMDLWISTHGLLGALYLKIHEQDSLAFSKNKAEEHLRKALEKAQPELFPADHLSVSIFWGRHLHKTKNYKGAAEVLMMGYKCLEYLRVGTTIAEHKAILNADLSELCGLLVDSLIQINRADEVFEYVVASKGRNLAETMNAVKPKFSEIIASRSDLAKLWGAMEDIWKSIENLQTKGKENPKKSRLKNDRRYDDIRLRLAQLYHQYRSLRSELFSSLPELDQYCYVPGIDRIAACRLAAELDSNIIEFFCHKELWIALLINKSGIKLIRYDADTADSIKMATSWKSGFDEPIPGSLSKIRERRILISLYEKLFRPLESDLARNDKIIIAPFGELHALPVSLAFDEKTQIHMFEKYTITTIPTINSLVALHKRTFSNSNSKREVFVVAHSGEGRNRLRHATSEGDTVAGVFSSPVALTEQNATPSKFLDIANDSSFDYIHICCHGSFSREYPERSGLQLEGLLTVKEIVSTLRINGDPLVTLSACQSGVSTVAAGDELQGLPQAIFQVGGRKVLASLWAVDDQATAAFFKAFYTNAVVNGINESTALVRAMNQLRSEEKYASAYFWGAFQLYGIA